MNTRRLVFLGAFALAIGSMGLTVNAADAASSEPRFAGEPLAFEATPLAFSASALTFSSAPIQTETAATIEVTLPADILFDFDKSDLRPTAQTALREVADLIREKGGKPVVVQGFTDALGNDAYNQKLSERRAGAVKIWLATKENLSAVRFTTAGFGPRNPVAPNRKPDGTDDPEGRQLNRRVTLIIHK